MVELLKKAGAVPPPEIDAATLQSYVGTYKGDSGRETNITLKDGQLAVLFTGQQPIALMALDKTSFKPAAFDGLSFTFKLENNKVTGLEFKQGATPTLLKRIEETKPQ